MRFNLGQLGFLGWISGVRFCNTERSLNEILEEYRVFLMVLAIDI